MTRDVGWWHFSLSLCLSSSLVVAPSTSNIPLLSLAVSLTFSAANQWHRNRSFNMRVISRATSKNWYNMVQRHALILKSSAHSDSQRHTHIQGERENVCETESVGERQRERELCLFSCQWQAQIIVVVGWLVSEIGVFMERLITEVGPSLVVSRASCYHINRTLSILWSANWSPIRIILLTANKTTPSQP